LTEVLPVFTFGLQVRPFISRQCTAGQVLRGDNGSVLTPD
jgi:hypothetical protein